MRNTNALRRRETTPRTPGSRPSCPGIRSATRVALLLLALTATSCDKIGIIQQDPLPEEEGQAQTTKLADPKKRPPKRYSFPLPRRGFNTDPETIENCFDGFDNNHDGKVDCMDPQCDNECLPESYLCGDGLDNDADGLTDCEDPDCIASPECAPTTSED